MTLRHLIAAEIGQPVGADIRALAASVAARHAGSIGVIFYGAALRDGSHTREAGSLIDLYLLVEDYGQAFDAAWLAVANRLLPPNVFPCSHGELRGKYAVVSIKDFRRLCSSAATDVSLFARMAQPVRLAWANGRHVPEIVADALADAVQTLLDAARPMLDETGTALALWRGALSLTYGCELRAERTGRVDAIIQAQSERCLRLAASAGYSGTLSPVTPTERDMAEARWRRWRRRGKSLSIARLLKAAFTYSGGIDYLAEKVSRHSGATVSIRPWMRTHPVIAGLLIAPRLWWRSAIR